LSISHVPRFVSTVCEYAVYTQNRTNVPRFRCQRAHDVNIGSVQCRLSQPKTREEKGGLQLLQQTGSSWRADLNVDAPRLAVGLVLLGLIVPQLPSAPPWAFSANVRGVISNADAKRRTTCRAAWASPCRPALYVSTVRILSRQHRVRNGDPSGGTSMR